MSLEDFLEEDLGRGDVTSELLIPEGKRIKAAIMAKESGVLAGVEEAEKLCKSLGITIRSLVQDGGKLRKGQMIATLEGDARKMLGIERTLLNVLSHMSGIATMTSELTRMARRHNKRVFIAATRKTLPGLRQLEKKAVMIGGGMPHRYDLGSMILVKGNHLKIIGGIRKLEKTIRKGGKRKTLEVEATGIKEAVLASRLADIVMLDNMDPKEIKAAIREMERRGLRKRVILEASGGINKGNLADYAKTGVDIISMGSLTNSAKALDMSLRVA